MLSVIFNQLLNAYTADTGRIQSCWLEMEKHYTAGNRHYHTLAHLQNMYEQFLPVKAAIKDWDTLLFSLFYHDVVYQVTRHDNEEKSAELAEKRLQQIHFPVQKINACIRQIVTTKNHFLSADTDTNFFTDADLSILGAAPTAYEAYTKAIRKEYAVYPDEQYQTGRSSVLQRFLSMSRLYKTDHFYTLYEQQARNNMQHELAGL